MKNLNLSTQQVETVNHNHIRFADKWYRMLFGISSRLISVQNGIAFLEVEIHSGWKKTNEVTANKFIDSWGSHNPDLKNIDGWEVRIYTSEKIAGFTISPNEIDSPALQSKIDQMKAITERYLIFVYKVYKDNIKHPIFTLRDSNDIFSLEFATQVEIIRCGFFDINDPMNYMIYNSNLSGNLFIIPHFEDDYLLIARSENEYISEYRHLKASTKPVTYNIHGKLFYLINLQKEGLGVPLWLEHLDMISKTEIIIGTKNCQKNKIH